MAADAPAVGAPADGPTPPCRLLMEPTAASSSTDHHIAADGYENVEDANFQDLLLATVPSEVPPVPLIEMTPDIKGFLERADQVWSQGPEGPGSRPRPSSACTEQARQTIDAGQTAVDPPQMVIPTPKKCRDHQHHGDVESCLSSPILPSPHRSIVKGPPL